MTTILSLLLAVAPPAFADTHAEPPGADDDCCSDDDPSSSTDAEPSAEPSAAADDDCCTDTQASSAEWTEPEPEPEVESFHGMRVGYSFVNVPDDSEIEPHNLVMGYEIYQRINGGGPVDVIVIENFMVSGINQSLFLPAVNVLAGFEFGKQVQIGVGPNLDLSALLDERPFVHMIAGIGYVPEVGAFNIPVHVSWIPDRDGVFRIAATTGVNW